MIHILRRLTIVFVFAFALALAAAAHATPMSPDPTGYWHNPSESGWGVAIAQQDETLFATLLVYDEQRRPAWFVASGVRDTGNGVFSGMLYRTSGPWFGASFDPGTVENQAVGTLTLQYAVVAVGQASIRLSYTVNGTTVTKALVRMTWESNAVRLPGAYYGGMSVALSPVPQPNGCVPDVPTFFPAGGELRVTMSAPDTIALIHADGIDTASIIAGTYLQSGQFGVVTGFIFRGPLASQLRIADALITNLVVSADGFLGHIQVVKDLCVYEGAISGIRRSP